MECGNADGRGPAPFSKLFRNDKRFRRVSYFSEWCQKGPPPRPKHHTPTTTNPTIHYAAIPILHALLTVQPKSNRFFAVWPNNYAPPPLMARQGPFNYAPAKVFGGLHFPLPSKSARTHHLGGPGKDGGGDPGEDEAGEGGNGGGHPHERPPDLRRQAEGVGTRTDDWVTQD